MYGTHLSDRPAEEADSLAKILAPFECFGWDAVRSPAHSGRIRHALAPEGQIIGPLDLLIAAHGLNKLSHFRRVAELRVEEWTAAT